jgi:hypothetical protein
MLAMESSRDMLEKLKREIERLAGSIIRQEVVDHAVNAAMTAWHLTDCTWREIRGSIPRRRTLTARAGTPIKELKEFQEFVKRDCIEMADCEGIAVSTRHFAFSKFPVFSTKVAERFKIGPVPIGKDGGATQHPFSPTGESISYTTQASELWIHPSSFKMRCTVSSSEAVTTGNEARTHCAWSFLEIHCRIRCSRWSREFLRIGATASAGEYRCRSRVSVVIRPADHDDAAVDRR